jgi:hypothetical protein
LEWAWPAGSSHALILVGVAIVLAINHVWLAAGILIFMGVFSFVIGAMYGGSDQMGR